MNLETQQLEKIRNITEFRLLMYENNKIKTMPNEIIDAVLKNDIPLDAFKHIVKKNDSLLNEKIIKALKRKKIYENNIIDIAEFSVKRSKMMKKKIENLNKQLNKGLLLNTVWNIGKRDNYAGDPKFYGNAPTQIIEQCILRLTNKKDIILDAMAGSGTTIDVCKVLKRKCIAYDINPQRKDIIKNNSVNIPLKNEKVGMVFLHPPYWRMVKYSKDKNDLSRQSLKDFFESVKSILLESKRVLKKNKYICILTGDMIYRGKFIPLSRKIANIAEDIGLEDCGQAIKITSNSVSQIRRGKSIYAELVETKNLKINHDFVTFWKK
ncbi:MAG: DNA methyltransferase [Candidatus Aenigmatarchaeota archaeon]